MLRQGQLQQQILQDQLLLIRAQTESAAAIPVYGRCDAATGDSSIDEIETDPASIQRNAELESELAIALEAAAKVRADLVASDSELAGARTSAVTSAEGAAASLLSALESRSRAETELRASVDREEAQRQRADSLQALASIQSSATEALRMMTADRDQALSQLLLLRGSSAKLVQDSTADAEARRSAAESAGREALDDAKGLRSERVAARAQAASKAVAGAVRASEAESLGARVLAVSAELEEIKKESKNRKRLLDKGEC